MDFYRKARALFIAAAVGLFLSGSLSGFVPPGHDKDLPNFDKRRQAAEGEADAGAGAKRKALPPTRAAAAEKLANRVPGLRIERDPLLQSPKHVFAAAGYLTGPNGEGRATSAQGARTFAPTDRHRGVKVFLHEHAPLFGHGAEALNQARLRRESVGRHNGLRTVVWEQRLDDVAVYEGVLVGNLTRQGELVSLSSQFLPDPAAAADAGTPNRRALQANPAISAAQAVMLAAEIVGEAVEFGSIVSRTDRPEGAELRQFFKAGVLPGEAQARLVWLPWSESSLRLCWEIELTRRANGERFRVMVDAQTGDISLRQRLTVYASDATYRVFTSDSPSPFSPGWPTPNTNQPPQVSRSLVTLGALSTNASPIGWISEGENETRGNNVDSHLDRNGDDVPDLPRAQGLPHRVFDAPLDLSQGPSNYTDAASIQLFYWCNWAHDRLYDLGFDEAAGNYQKDNFGRGGIGNDPILADAQDGSGFNNANFTPVPDGQPGRIQMFIWNGPNPDIDGDFDAEVVLHEYVHGLSTRLVGGGVGIGTLQAAGMGEGWSDFYALSLLSEPGDDPDASYPFGGYASTLASGLKENYYFGIRRYPYSTDLAKNPLTFKDIDPGQALPHEQVPISPLFGFNPLNASEVHAQGEVWCAMLWEARAQLVRKHGYSAGNELILQLVTDGMKLSPPNPNFIQARDAIILADQVNNAGANYGDLWAAFAKRGLGFSASSPDSTTTIGVVEAYDRPDSLFISNPLAFISSGPIKGPIAPNCQNYPLTNISEQTISWTARVTQPWLSVSPTNGVLPPGGVANVTVCLTDAALVLPLGTFSDSIVFSNTVTKVAQTRRAEVRLIAFTSMPFEDTFESGRLQPWWSVSGTGAHLSQVTPQYEPHAGNYHLTLDSLNGVKARNELTLGIDLAGYSNVVLRFWAKSFGDEPDGPPASPFVGGADFDGVAISEDGVNWFEVQGLRLIPSEYTSFIVDLDAAIAAHGLRYSPTFRVRFNQVDDFQIPFDGLSLDDISISGTAVRRLFVELPPHATEGDGPLTQRATVRLGAPTAAALTVRLTSSQSSLVSVPASVVIPAGSDRVSFPVTVLDNSDLDGTSLVSITAEATGIFGGSAVIEVADNERATLRVKLHPRAREGDGRMVKHGTVRVQPRPVRDVVARLESSDTGELIVPASVVLRAGEHSADFDLTVVDDDRIDGTRPVTVTVRVENWTSGADTMTILDNDVPAVFVALPASASEGNLTLTNAGSVRLSGRLPTNLVVQIKSADLSELVVPATVTVTAGQLAASFNLTPMDDAQIDGPQLVQVSAQAAGFAPGSGTMTIFDDETPPLPRLPRPADGATEVPISVELAWSPGIGNIVVNGGFESGDFTGWVTENGGYGAWLVNNGTLDPDGPEGTNAPVSGRFNAMVAQIGGGQHLLYQDVFIPPDALGATLRWSDRIRNYTPYFAPSQGFRVEIRDTNHNVLALAFTTQPDDPLLTEWKSREFDLSSFRGQTVRLAFYEEDSTGYFNLYLDDIRVDLTAPPVPTTFDVYFGTTPTPGAAELLGNTTNVSWALPPLALNTRYYWQIVSKRGAASIRGPVWQFTTRGVGAVHHFEWAQIPSPQFVDQPFAVTVTARDDIGNVVKDFTSPVAVAGLAGSGTASAVAISEVEIANNDRVEFVNVSLIPVDLSGWQISVYDVVSWPRPLNTITLPAGSVCPPGGFFLLNDQGEAPGFFPNFNAGSNINWSISAIGNPIAVVLRDSGSNVVDFIAAGTARPDQIQLPLPIPAEEWSGQPVFAALPQNALTLQRIGNYDHNNATDWVTVSGTFGSLNPGMDLLFNPRPTIAVTPTVLTNFTTGIWSGYLTVKEPAPRLTLRADDGENHRGTANEIAVSARNDMSVAVADSPDVVILGDTLTYLVTVTNSGPDKATGLIVTNQLPAEVSFLSAATFSGVCSNVERTVICVLDPVSVGDNVRITIATRAEAPASATNLAALFRPGPDGYAANNRALAVTTITGPSISTTNVTLLEGNGTTTVARVPVRLSTACTLPVSVHYATSNSTAVAGADFTAVEGTLVFNPGVTNLTIDVPIVGDLLNESIDTFFVNLSEPINGVIIVGQSRIRINNDDPMPSLSIDDVTITEGPEGTTNQAVFTVRLSAPSGITVGSSFTTGDRSAVAPADYLTTFGTLTFRPGETNQTITVASRGDNRFESNETFNVTLTVPFGAFLSRSQGIGTILDDDDDELDRFVWSTVPSPQFVGHPFTATLTARDGLDRTAIGFNGPVTLRAIADSREVTVGTSTGTNTWEFPLGSLFHDARTQVIYLPSELGGPGKINGLALQVTNVPGQTLSNWTIRLKHTPLTRYGAGAWETDGWTTVYRNDETILASGWVTFLFAEPFDYDGVSSLMVDFSFNNATYSVNGLVRATPTSERRSLFFQTDSAFGNPLTWSGPSVPPPLLSARVPNVRFTLESPLPTIPEGTIQLIAGVWTGSIQVLQPGADIFLRASDQAGHLANGNLFAVQDAADADADGLPDQWETRYFGSTAAAPEADPDQDGSNNLAELRAGTDPASAASGLAIQSVHLRGADVVVRFNTAPGRSYRLERATNLANPEWTPVSSIVPGTGAGLEIIDRNAAQGTSGFYRIIVVQ